MATAASSAAPTTDDHDRLSVDGSTPHSAGVGGWVEKSRPPAGTAQVRGRSFLAVGRWPPGRASARTSSPDKSARAYRGQQSAAFPVGVDFPGAAPAAPCARTSAGTGGAVLTRSPSRRGGIS